MVEAEPSGGVVVRNPVDLPRGEPAALPPRMVEAVAELRGLSADRMPPCEGCIPERGVLDVVDTFLFHMGREYIDMRAELYSEIAARLEAAGLAAPRDTPLPELPAFAADVVPPGRALRGSYLPEVERPEETWVVWVQVGWWSVEPYIDVGVLSLEAASWPPVKKERYMLVDARTGKVDTRAMWLRGTRRAAEEMPAYGELAAKAAAERAEHWLSQSGAASGP